MAAGITSAETVNGVVKADHHRSADGVAGHVLPDREVVRLAVVDAAVVDDGRPAVNEQQILIQGCTMTGNTRKRPMISYTGSILVVASGLMAFFVTDRLAAQAQGAGQQDLAGKQTYFQTPDTAVKALLKALKANDDKAILDIFGPKYAKKIVPRDRVENRVNRMRAYRAAQEMLVWEKEGKGKRILVIGHEAWPMPIPLVKEAKGWRFDTASGIDEIMSGPEERLARAPGDDRPRDRLRPHRPLPCRLQGCRLDPRTGRPGFHPGDPRPPATPLRRCGADRRRVGATELRRTGRH